MNESIMRGGEPGIGKEHVRCKGSKLFRVDDETPPIARSSCMLNDTHDLVGLLGDRCEESGGKLETIPMCLVEASLRLLWFAGNMQSYLISRGSWSFFSRNCNVLFPVLEGRPDHFQGYCDPSQSSSIIQSKTRAPHWYRQTSQGRSVNESILRIICAWIRDLKLLHYHPLTINPWLVPPRIQDHVIPISFFPTTS